MTWQAFLSHHWSRLTAGDRVVVPFVGHPADVGFSPTSLAEPSGQLEDWVMSLSDGSRLHLWLMPEGRWILHRDRTDPARGPVEATTHWLTESKSGKFAAVLLGIAAVGYGIYGIRTLSRA